ncbi:hypothetical protein JOD97_001927 [Duganella sp. 1411]|jgi:hypothetical protein|uniref:hypothetical protein n=1 Tax=Duganella sp. 1411 TaxID=2806572 RepID=UPI001AE56399|nr:hypothetical protein [Duganella sp. 1411]MBP1203913.1 hypothetical protein [Duganella sp. 1411]
MNMDKFSKAERGLAQILKLTQFGELEWLSGRAPIGLINSDDYVAPYYFETEYLGKKLGLFQQYRRIPQSGLAETASERIRVVLFGEGGEVDFEFPPTPFTRRLFNAVRLKASKVEGFLDALIKLESQDVKL